MKKYRGDDFFTAFLIAMVLGFMLQYRQTYLECGENKKGVDLFMARIAIPMLKKFQRPIIELYGFNALIDTGAVIPMFSVPVTTVKEKFSAEKILEKHSIGGIGGESYGDVYRIDEFCVGELVYAPFDVFVPIEPNLKYPILLGAPLFHGMFYGFDTTENQFIIETKEAPLRRSFKLHELRGQLFPQIDDVFIQDSSLLLSNMPFGLWV